MTSCAPPLPRTRHCPLRGVAHFLPFAPGQARDWVGSRWAHSKVRSPKNHPSGTFSWSQATVPPRTRLAAGKVPSRALGTGRPAAPGVAGPPVQPWGPLSSPSPSEAAARLRQGTEAPHRPTRCGRRRGAVRGSLASPAGCGSGSLPCPSAGSGSLYS